MKTLQLIFDMAFASKKLEILGKVLAIAGVAYWIGEYALSVILKP